MRWVMTRVLPDPAPARTSCGPSPWVTAAICSGLSLRSSSWDTGFFTPGSCPSGWGDGKAEPAELPDSISPCPLGRPREDPRRALRSERQRHPHPRLAVRPHDGRQHVLAALLLVAVDDRHPGRGAEDRSRGHVRKEVRLMVDAGVADQR